MKFIYLSILLCGSLFCYSQKISTSINPNFVLNGKVAGRNSGPIILQYQDSTNTWLNDTAWLKKGKFIFKGVINEPTFGILGNPTFENGGEMNSVDFFLEPKKMTIKLTEGNYENGDLKGSKTQEEYKLFLRQKEDEAHKLASIVNKITEVKKIYNSAQTDSIEKITLEETLNQLRTEMDKINLQITDITYRYIDQYPDSYITAYLLNRLQERPSIKFFEQAYAKFSDKIKNSRYGKYISDDIKRRLLVEVGALSPDFTAFDIEGNKITLSALRGKTVLLDFWASWCVPCREGIPELKKFYELYHPSGFEIITISVDRSKEDWKKGVSDEKIANFYNVLTNEEITKGFENIFLPIPSQILINREGEIVWKKTFNKATDEKNLGNKLAEIFMK